MKQPKKKQTNWGGSRDGSGRKPKGRERFTVYLTPERVESARKGIPKGNLSDWIDAKLLEAAQ